MTYLLVWLLSLQIAVLYKIFSAIVAVKGSRESSAPNTDATKASSNIAPPLEVFVGLHTKVINSTSFLWTLYVREPRPQKENEKKNPGSKEEGGAAESYCQSIVQSSATMGTGTSSPLTPGLQPSVAGPRRIKRVIFKVSVPHNVPQSIPHIFERMHVLLPSLIRYHVVVQCSTLLISLLLLLDFCVLFFSFISAGTALFAPTQVQFPKSEEVFEPADFFLQNTCRQSAVLGVLVEIVATKSPAISDGQAKAEVDDDENTMRFYAAVSVKLQDTHLTETKHTFFFDRKKPETVVSNDCKIPRLLAEAVKDRECELKPSLGELMVSVLASWLFAADDVFIRGAGSFQKHRFSPLKSGWLSQLAFVVLVLQLRRP